MPAHTATHSPQNTHRPLLHSLCGLPWILTWSSSRKSSKVPNNVKSLPPAKKSKPEPNIHVQVRPQNVTSTKRRIREYAPLFAPRQACLEFYEILQDTSYKLADLRLVYSPSEDRDSLFVHSRTMCSQSAKFEQIYERAFGKIVDEARKGGTCSQQRQQSSSTQQFAATMKVLRIRESTCIDPEILHLFFKCLAFPRMDNKERVVLHKLEGAVTMGAIDDAVQFLYLCKKWKVQWNVQPLLDKVQQLFEQYLAREEQIGETNESRPGTDSTATSSCHIDLDGKELLDESIETTTAPPVVISHIYSPRKGFWDMCTQVFEPHTDPVHRFLSLVHWERQVRQSPRGTSHGVDLVATTWKCY